MIISGKEEETYNARQIIATVRVEFAMPEPSKRPPKSVKMIFPADPAVSAIDKEIGDDIMFCLKCGLKLTQPINLQHMVNSMMECANLIVGNPEINERTQDNISINNESIRKSPLFRVVQDDYEKAYSLFKRKVKLNDNQK